MLENEFLYPTRYNIEKLLDKLVSLGFRNVGLAAKFLPNLFTAGNRVGVWFCRFAVLGEGLLFSMGFP